MRSLRDLEIFCKKEIKKELVDEAIKTFSSNDYNLRKINGFVKKACEIYNMRFLNPKVKIDPKSKLSIQIPYLKNHKKVLPNKKELRSVFLLMPKFSFNSFLYLLARLLNCKKSDSYCRKWADALFYKISVHKIINRNINYGIVVIS